MKKKITALILAVIMCLSFIISAAAADTLKRVPSTIPGTDKEYNYVENVTVKIPGTNVTFDLEKVADFVLVDKTCYIGEQVCDIPCYNFYLFEKQGKVTYNQDGMGMYGFDYYTWGEAFPYPIHKGYDSDIDDIPSDKDKTLCYFIETIITSDNSCVNDYNINDDAKEALYKNAIAMVTVKLVNPYSKFFDYDEFNEKWYRLDNHDEAIDISTLDVNYTPDEDYKITDGANAVVNSDTRSLKIRADGDFSKFTGVKVDGKTVDSNNYTASEGSTVVEFKDEYLSTLSAGKHTVEILFADGKATTQFEIKRDKNTDKTDKPQSPNVEIPNTDGSTSVTSVFAVMALSGMALITFKHKKKK